MSSSSDAGSSLSLFVSPSEPSLLRCVERGLDFAILEAELEAVRQPWQLEMMGEASWMFEQWTLASDVVVMAGRSSCNLRVSHLEPEKSYAFRMLQGGDAGVFARCFCPTADLPQVPAMPVCSRRRPGSLRVEVAVPRCRSPMFDCELQYSKTTFYSAWSSKFLNQTDNAGRYSFLLDDLCSATEYIFRARLRDSAGRFSEFSEVGHGKTSDPPSAPQRLELVSRHAHSVTLSCQLEDPEGAPVSCLEADIAGDMTWQPIAISWQWAVGFLDSCTQTGTSTRRTVHVTVANLPAGEKSSLRIWASNVVGRSPEPSMTFCCLTSVRPKCPSQVTCISRDLQSIQISWLTEDPEGAPVHKCCIEYALDDLLSPWHRFIVGCKYQNEHNEKHATWKATVKGLLAETSYAIRLSALNEVGWSSSQPDPLKCRTADRPPPPCNLRCSDKTACAVKLHFQLSCDPLQSIARATSVLVQYATSFSWEEIPETDVRITENTYSSVPGLQDVSILVERLAGDREYCIRLWPGNAVGQSSEPSEAFRFRTSSRPEPPRQLVAKSIGPHTLELTWDVDDPDGAPVKHSELQSSQSSMLSAWHNVGTETLMSSAHKWTQVVHGLEANQSFVFRARAWNAAGWSEWSEPISWSTPAAPEISDLHVRTQFQDEETDDHEFCIPVFFRLRDPGGAPTIVCTVTGRWNNEQVLAQRQSETLWKAQFKGDVSTPHHLEFTVRAANAVGWSHLLGSAKLPDYAFDQSELQGSHAVDTQEHIASMSYSALQTVSSFVERSLVEMQSMETFWKTCLGRAESFFDLRHEQSLATHLVESQLAIHGLQSVSKSVKETSRGLDSGQATCSKLGESELQSVAENSKEAVQALMAAFVLLLEGICSVARLSMKSLEPLWKDVCFLAEASPEQADSHRWICKRQEWFLKAQNQMLDAWPGALATAAQLLAAASCHSEGKPALLGTQVKQDLEALRRLHGMIELQIQELKDAAKSLNSLIAGSSAFLVIYDLHGASAVSALTQLAGLGGVYHVAVHVYWLEWSFGWSRHGSGLHSVHAGTSSLGKLRDQIPLGQTPCSPDEVLEILEDMRASWSGKSYDMLRRNCGHFSQEFVLRLKVQEAPEWVNSLATAGGNLVEWLGAMEDDSVQMANEQGKPLTVNARERIESVEQPDACNLSDPESAECSRDEEAEWDWAARYIQDRSAQARRVRQMQALNSWKVSSATMGRSNRRRSRQGQVR